MKLPVEVSREVVCLGDCVSRWYGVPTLTMSGYRNGMELLDRQLVESPTSPGRVETTHDHPHHTPCVHLEAPDHPPDRLERSTEVVASCGQLPKRG